MINIDRQGRIKEIGFEAVTVTKYTYLKIFKEKTSVGLHHNIE